MVLLQHRLNVKLSQRQILTPGLVQMVSVLALNKLELKDMINTEMVENPVLEELEDSVPLLDEVGRKEEDRDRAASATTEETPTAEAEKKDPFEEIDFGSFFQDYLDPGYRTRGEMEEIERPSFENFLSKPTNLTDHLAWQLGALSLRPEVREAADLIIGNLNEDGYLIASDDELMGIAVPASPEADAVTAKNIVSEAQALGLDEGLADPSAIPDEFSSEAATADAEIEEVASEDVVSEDVVSESSSDLITSDIDAPELAASDLIPAHTSSAHVADVDLLAPPSHGVQDFNPSNGASSHTTNSHPAKLDVASMEAAFLTAASVPGYQPLEAFLAPRTQEPAATAVAPAPELPKLAPKKTSPPNYKPSFTLADLTEALEVVRQLDPPGVACRELRACLLCQLRYHQEQLLTHKSHNADGNGNGGIHSNGTAQILQDATAIVDQHLRGVQNKQHKEIAKAISRRPRRCRQRSITFAPSTRAPACVSTKFRPGSSSPMSPSSNMATSGWSS